MSVISLAFFVAPARAEKIFIFSNASHNLKDFRPYASLAARLKPYGRVQMTISALSDKSWYEIPPGGSPWHEYACYISTPWKYYPHPNVAPFIPADFVAKNRELLLGKAAIVRELGLEAAAELKENHFLPEAFFQKYPQLRGPRVDHPRRSKKEEFSWCVDLPETREMIEWMMAEIKKNVPEIQTVTTGTNDAGAGLCWAEAQYPGPNGPRQCRNINVGRRVRTLSETIHQGAVKGGGEVTLRWGNVNFWRNEMDIVLPLLPPNTYIDWRDPAVLSIGTLINEVCPVLGLFDPLEVIADMERYSDPRKTTIMINYSPWYERSDESPETVGKLLDLMEDCIKEPPSGTLWGRLEKLKKMSGIWGGEKNREKIFEAFYKMHEALQFKNYATTGYAGYSNTYCGVSLRHMIRPLVIKPELLKPADEAYFLPFVFSIHENDARTDYIEFHGGRMTGTSSWEDEGLRRALATALDAAKTLESLEDAPQGEWLKKIALGLRIWASEVRSIHNFYHGQMIRDANAKILAGPPRIPSKDETWDGEKGNLEWNEIMRDEFDNTNELITLLDHGGLEIVARAKDPRYEDTFLLGPDLVDQLKKKARIMREHWLDIQDYLAPPLK